MASAIGDGLLGFIAGAAGGAAQGEQQKFQSQLQLDRQLSLLQAQRSFAEQDNAALQQQLFESLPEEQREAINLESPEDVARFTTQEGRLLTQTVAQQQQSQKDQEEAERLDRGVRALIEGEATTQQKADLVTGGVLDVEDLREQERPITPELLETDPRFAGKSEAELELFASQPSEALKFLQGGKDSGKLPIDLVNIETGKVETVPFEKARRLLEAGTHTRGELAFSGGEEVIRTPKGDFPRNVPKIKDEDLTERARTFDDLGERLRNLPALRAINAAEADPEFIKPELAIDLATGPQDKAFAGLRAFGATNALLNTENSELGEAQLAVKKELLSLRALTRNALVAANPGRANASTIDLADELSPSTGTLNNIFGSGDNVRSTLENLRGLMRSIRTTNQEVIGDSQTRQAADRATEAVKNTNRVIGRIEAMFASEKIGALRLTNQQGRTVSVANGLDTSGKVSNFVRQNSRNLSQEEKGLLLQWQRHLMQKEGF